MKLLLAEDSDLSTVVWVRKIKYYFLWNKSKTFWRGSPRKHVLRMGVERLPCLLVRAIANGAGDSTALIQGSFSFLVILTEQRTTSESCVCVLPAQGCVKIMFHWDTLALIAYFAENLPKPLWWVQMLADYLGLPASSTSFQCPHLCLSVHLKAELPRPPKCTLWGQCDCWKPSLEQVLECSVLINRLSEEPEMHLAMASLFVRFI